MYLVVVAALRVMGKRQLGEMEPSEFVTAIIISELAAMPIVETDKPILHAVAAVAVLMLLEIGLSLLMFKSKLAKKLLCASPSVLIKDGKPQYDQLRRNRVTMDELREELRIMGITDLSKVKVAMLESNGKLSVQ